MLHLSIPYRCSTISGVWASLNSQTSPVHGYGALNSRSSFRLSLSSASLASALACLRRALACLTFNASVSVSVASPLLPSRSYFLQGLTSLLIEQLGISCVRNKAKSMKHTRSWLENRDKFAPPEFAKLATEYSECPSGKKGGDLGRFPQGKMSGPFQ